MLEDKKPLLSILVPRTSDSVILHTFCKLIAVCDNIELVIELNIWQGLQQATGKYVLFLSDPRARLAHDAVQRTLARLETAEDAAFLFWERLVAPDGRYAGFPWFLSGGYAGEDSKTEVVCPGYCPPLDTMLFHRETLLSMGRFLVNAQPSLRLVWLELARRKTIIRLCPEFLLERTPTKASMGKEERFHVNRNTTTVSAWKYLAWAVLHGRVSSFEMQVFKIALRETHGAFYRNCPPYRWLRNLSTSPQHAGQEKSPIRHVKYSDPAPDSKQVLACVPSAIFGGAGRVMVNIMQGLSRRGYAFRHHSVDTPCAAWTERAAPYLNGYLGPSLDYNNNKDSGLTPSQAAKDILLITNSPTGYDLAKRLREEKSTSKTVDVLHTPGEAFAAPEYAPLARDLDARVCISKKLENSMRAVYAQAGIEEKYVARLCTIYNGIDMDVYRRRSEWTGSFRNRLGLPTESRLIVWLGRFTEEKDPFLFLDTVKTILATSNAESFHFVMAGAGVLLPHAHAYAKTLEIIDNVTFVGELNDEEVLRLLTDAYLLVLTSRYEGLPMVVLEALAMDVPVIATEVGAMDEAVQQGKNGYFFPNDHLFTARVSETIEQLNKKPELYEALQSNARSSVIERFSLTTMAQQYDSVFTRLLTGQ